MSRLSLTVLFWVLSAAFIFQVPALSEEQQRPRTGWEAYGALMRGNLQFQKNQSRADETRSLEYLSEQFLDRVEPIAIVLTCSDPRVVPEFIFDQGFGSLVTLRLPGGLVDGAATAGVEDALVRYTPPLLVIMVSEACGALGPRRTGDQFAAAELSGLAEFDRRVARLYQQPRPNRHEQEMPNPLRRLGRGVEQKLLQHSKLLQFYFEHRGLVLAQAVFHRAQGKVHFWSVGQPAFRDPRAGWTQSRTGGFESYERFSAP